MPLILYEQEKAQVSHYCYHLTTPCGTSQGSTLTICGFTYTNLTPYHAISAPCMPQCVVLLVTRWPLRQHRPCYMLPLLDATRTVRSEPMALTNPASSELACRQRPVRPQVRPPAHARPAQCAPPPHTRIWRLLTMKAHRQGETVNSVWLSCAFGVQQGGSVDGEGVVRCIGVLNCAASAWLERDTSAFARRRCFNLMNC